MIQNFSAKDLIGFESVWLEFSPSLNVFSGPSGAGKSVLIDGILASIGLSDVKAVFVESQTNDAIFRAVRKEKTRWFYNDEPISKKALIDLASQKILYLSANDSFAFQRQSVLGFLETDAKKEYDEAYLAYVHANQALKELKLNALDIEQRREFLAFEIAKINEINPQIGEEEELLAKKKAFAQREKLQNALNKISPLLNAKSSVATLFEIFNINQNVSDDFFAELEDAILSAENSLSYSDNIDKIMQRLDELSYVIKKYGGISEALDAKAQKLKMLSELDNIGENSALCEINAKKAKQTMQDSAFKLSQERQKIATNLIQEANKFLASLKLGKCNMEFIQVEPDSFGMDDIIITLDGVRADKISSGEARRLRLALYAASVSSTKEVLILDEADANLSGAESAAVAELLNVLSKKYQLFVITHQPQTAAIAKSHFLVSKNEFGSNVRLLSQDERVGEIARMLSGEKIESQALELAKMLIK